MVRLVYTLIYAYLYVLGPLMRFLSIAPSPCRFYPTCSHYALEAFAKHPFVTAFGLTLRRIMRCNPLTTGGYDPVPTPTKKQET